MRLFLSKSHEPALGRLTPSMIKVKKMLDLSADGELFTTVQVARINKLSRETVERGCYLLPEYHHKVRVRLKYWGKPSTIKELRKELQK